MSDDDKTPTRHARDWARAIPLVTLLGVVFASGIVYAKLQTNSTGLDNLASKLDKYAEASEARLRSLEQYRIAHEAMTTPMMAKFLEEHSPRPISPRKAAAKPTPAAKDLGP